uniref:Uncharacterized protein n=2 Tax=Noccaea caerulescens TaxID=107243 RepID=A0A1J3K627_NOCCA
MQQGLPAGYDYADYVVVPINAENKEINLKACNLESIAGLSHEKFKFGLAKLIHDNNKGYVSSDKLKHAELPQLLLAAFDSDLWNKFNPGNKVDVYKPIWDDPNRKQNLPPHFKPRKRIFYKFNAAMFFQVKKLHKNERNANGEIILNPLTKKLLELLT